MRKILAASACVAALMGATNFGTVNDAVSAQVNSTSAEACVPNTLDTPVTALHVLPDDRILVARQGLNNRFYMELRNSDGVLVKTFGNSTFNDEINAVTADATHAYVGGSFTTTYNTALSAKYVARFNLSDLDGDSLPDLDMDSTWQTAANAVVGTGGELFTSVRALLVDSTGKLLVGGEEVYSPGNDAFMSLIRLTGEGALDSSYTNRETVVSTGRVEALASIPNSTDIYALASENGTFAVQRIPAAGTANKDVNEPGYWYTPATPATSGYEGYGLALTPEGGAIATGRQYAREFSPTGDAVSFGDNADGLLVYQKLVVAHSRDGQDGFVFAKYWGAGQGVQRANRDGTLDSTFQTRFRNLGILSGDFNAIATQSDGRIVVGGSFTVEQSSTNSANNLIRLNANGTIDPAFNVASVPDSGCADPTGQDSVVPTATISRVGTGTLGVGETETISVALSEVATDFTVDDITVTGGTLSGFTGSGTTYSATFTPTADSSGTATIDIAAGAFTDAATNPNTAATQLSIAYDTAVAPTATISRAGTGTLGVGDTETISIELSEVATDFTVDDITVTGGTLTGFTGSGTTYSATFTPTADSSGTATIDIAAGAFTDAATNPNTAATQLSIAYDTAVTTTTTATTTTTTTATTTTEPASATATAPTAPVITVAEVPAVGLSKVQRSDGRSVRSTIEATTSDAASTITIRNDDGTEFTVVHEPTLLRANFTVYRGTTLAISGDGYEPNTDIDIWLNSSPTLLGSATTTETGTFTFDVVVPLDFELGDHVLQVEGTVDTDVDQATFIGLTVLDRFAAELPATGSNWSGALAALMITVGAVLALVSLRRRSGSSLVAAYEEH